MGYNRGTCQHKIFYPTIDRKRSKKLLNLARLTLTMVIRAITGHNFLGYHQNKVDPHTYKICRLCEESDEKFVHILTECPRLWLTRQEIYLDQTPTQGGPWSLDKLLQFIHIPVVFDMLTSKDGLANIADITEDESE